jgi:hypothetical protein
VPTKKQERALGILRDAENRGETSSLSAFAVRMGSKKTAAWQMLVRLAAAGLVEKAEGRGRAFRVARPRPVGIPLFREGVAEAEDAISTDVFVDPRIFRGVTAENAFAVMCSSDKHPLGLALNAGEVVVCRKGYPTQSGVLAAAVVGGNWILGRYTKDSIRKKFLHTKAGERSLTLRKSANFLRGHGVGVLRQGVESDVDWRVKEKIRRVGSR